MPKNSTPGRRANDRRHPFFRIEAHPRMIAAGTAALLSLSANLLFRSVENTARGSADVQAELHQLAQRIDCAKGGK